MLFAGNTSNNSSSSSVWRKEGKCNSALVPLVNFRDSAIEKVSHSRWRRLSRARAPPPPPPLSAAEPARAERRAFMPFERRLCAMSVCMCLPDVKLVWAARRRRRRRNRSPFPPFSRVTVTKVHFGVAVRRESVRPQLASAVESIYGCPPPFLSPHAHTM